MKLGKRRVGLGLRIFDGEEKEATGRCGRSGERAVAGGEKLRDGIGIHTPGTALNEGADQVANHVVEEAGCGHGVNKKSFALAPLRA